VHYVVFVFFFCCVLIPPLFTVTVYADKATSVDNQATWPMTLTHIHTRAHTQVYKILKTQHQHEKITLNALDA